MGIENFRRITTIASFHWGRAKRNDVQFLHNTLGSSFNNDWVDVQRIVPGRPPLTRMRDTTGLTPEVYDWLCTNQQVVRLVCDVIDRRCTWREGGILIFSDNDGKHASVAIAECVAATLAMCGKSNRVLTEVMNELE